MLAGDFNIPNGIEEESKSYTSSIQEERFKSQHNKTTFVVFDEGIRDSCETPPDLPDEIDYQ